MAVVDSVETLAKLGDPNRGRLVAVGLAPDGEHYREFTGMGGRSPKSKNRFYDIRHSRFGDFIKTAIHDPSLYAAEPDPEVEVQRAAANLYVVHKSMGGWHVAANGEQSEGILQALLDGKTFRAGQSGYTNEGKANDYTSRISVAVHDSRPNTMMMGRISRDPDNFENSLDDVWHLSDRESALMPGEAWLTVTYDGKGGTDPTYDNPWPFTLKGTLEEDMEAIWEAWDPNTRANLAGKEIEIGSGRFRYLITSIHPGRSLSSVA